MPDGGTPEWDYVVVGSGAGGGTLAARLVERGKSGFLLEAGSDPASTTDAARLPDDYEVPGFHTFACENPAMSWNFRVQHYSDPARQASDWKCDVEKGGVLYPRAATLGGCTAHNAMIFMLPHDSDWDAIADETGDRSWSSGRMRRYARRVESCQYRKVWRALRRLGIDPTGHGWNGWLTTERAIPVEALDDEGMLAVVLGTAAGVASSRHNRLLSKLRFLRSLGDPNVRRWGRRSFEGLCYTPLCTSDHQRIGTRERLQEVAARHRDRLHIEYDALATRVLFSDGLTARGVEYLKGARLYAAHAHQSSTAGERREVRARHEVILCGGAFNTPQLLMLSGIGPGDELRRHGIEPKLELDGVGRNLQDRYEVAVTHRMPQSWSALRGARFERDDPPWQSWHASREGMYASNGAAIGFVWRSQEDLPEPDIFCMALPARFEGYFSGFSDWIGKYHDYLTWAVLKAHTRNREGSVKLRSADPRAMPDVNFRYFDERDDPAGDDLAAVLRAIGYVRNLMDPLIESGLVAEELSPGRSMRSRADLEDYVRSTAWGHHASCSCRIGAPNNGGVLDSKFAVHGARGLRVVDASVFPRIPGFFVVSAVYMVAEKAADTILEAAGH